MHDVDQTQLETGFGGEYGYELQPEYEYGGADGAPREADEMELASELLEIESEEELDEFLGDVIKSVAKAGGDFLRSSAGKAVTGIAKDVARKALPSIGRSIGGIFGRQGGDIGAQLATRAGSMFGLELEGLSPQDQEFEVARQVIRFTQKAAEEAEKVAGSASPQQAAQQAVQRAAQQYAPGILQLLRGGPQRPQPRPRYGPDRGRGIVPPQQLQSIFGGRPQESPLSEVEEMELAGDLLGIQSEEELDEFLGDLVKKAANAVGGFVRSPVGRQITGVLKGVAKQALPALGAGAAGFFGLPPQVGQAAGSMIANTFELETEGMASEELEFEVARKIVQLGATTASNAASAPPNIPAKQVAQAAVQAAAQRYAPGLARQQQNGGEGREGGGARSGRWVRRGRKVVLYGV